MSELTPLLVDVFILFFAAKLFGEIFERLDQPAVIGELLAGVVIGPAVLGLVGRPSEALIQYFHGDRQAAQEAVHLVYHLLSELGVIVLLFFVGLETRASDLLRVGRSALTVAILGVVIPFLLGYAYMSAIGQQLIVSIFVGAALVATSVGITARVLRDLGRLTAIESRIILGAAVIDDILAIVVLAVVSGLAATGGVDVAAIGFIIVQALAFTGFLMLVGTGIARRYALRLDRLRTDDAAFIVAMSAMLGLAALAGLIGLAAIIGAFLAGMVFAEAREHFALEEQTRPVYQFLVPFFFAVTGTQVDPRIFVDPSIFGIAAVVTILAVIGKVVGCGVATYRMGWRSAAIVGVGMAPRGEVGLIVASIGRGLGAIPDTIFSVVVVMSIVTTLVVPPVLRVLFADHASESEPGAFAEAGRLPDT